MNMEIGQPLFMNKMKVTFITGHLCKERHALLYELAIDLGECGAQVTVITGFPSRRISNETREYYLNHPFEQISDNVVVKRVGSKKGEGESLFARMIKYYFLTRRLLKEALKTETDIYYLYSSPFFLGYIGKKLKKIAPTLYNAQDLFPDTLIHAKHLSENNLAIKYFRKKERKVYQTNNHIVTISNEMKETILKQGIPSERISVIYNWADVEFLHHVDRSENRLFDDFKINRSHFIVSYAGDLGLFQGWDTILNTAKLLERLPFNIDFVLIGNGSYRNSILEIIEKENLSNVYIFPLQSYSRVSEVYSFGDVELLPIESGLTKMAFPSKSGAIMAAGSPVISIVDKGSDIESIVQNNKIGLSVSPGNPDELAKAILYCYENKNLLNVWGENSRKYALKHFNRKIQTKRYFECLESVVNNGK